MSVKRKLTCKNKTSESVPDLHQTEHNEVKPWPGGSLAKLGTWQSLPDSRGCS